MIFLSLGLAETLQCRRELPTATIFCHQNKGLSKSDPTGLADCSASLNTPSLSP
jgi:hypothetical protein